MMLDTDDPGNDAFYFVNFGPGDQGILNKFYEADLRSHVMDPVRRAGYVWEVWKVWEEEV